MSLWRDLLSLIFPRNCVACNAALYKHEHHLCTSCSIGLPRSNFHTETNNELERVFAGRVPVLKACSYYVFEKSGKVQKVLHSIKYKSNTELAVQLGSWYAESLKDCKEITSSDVIIPVPLHKKKLRQRGFNQSEEFAKGLSKTFNIPLCSDNLIRNQFTNTQTRKKKFERWENVEGKFELKDWEMLRNKTILLVDDVITTGATIDACYQALAKAEGIKINVLSLAYAKRGG